MNNTVQYEGRIKEKIEESLDLNVGSEQTRLNKEYKDKITFKLINNNKTQKRKWATYNQLVIELNELGLFTKKKELQYKLTNDDHGDPKKICSKLIENIGDLTDELKRLYIKIKGF